MKKNRLSFLAIGLIVILIVLDQILKIWIKTHLLLGQDIPLIGNWFHLLFIENEGMAFGISFGENIGKLCLTLFRVGVVGLLIYYLHKLIKSRTASTLVTVIFSMIIAGALGNIIDSLFYGLIFSESTPFSIATAFPEGGGYAPFLFGRVVDMLYFPLFYIPEGFPIWGGEYFFPAIFNFADSCVTLGVIGVIIFNKRFFSEIEAARKASKQPVKSSSKNAQNTNAETVEEK